MTTYRNSQIDANAPVPAATLAQTRLPWTAPRLERLQGGNAQVSAKPYAPVESEPVSTLLGPS